jgi:hypothetical protein
MGEEEAGWSGVWAPHIVPEAVMAVLRELVGAPVMMRSGKPYERMEVNLRTGEWTYPSGGARFGQGI